MKVVKFIDGNPEQIDLPPKMVVLLVLEYGKSAGLSVEKDGVSFVTKRLCSFACIGVIMAERA